MKKTNGVTAADVAKKAGVSRWTVTRSFLSENVVSADTKEKVRKIAKEMGYLPNLVARSLIKKETGMVAIVVDNFMNYNVCALMREMSKQLQQKKLLPILINIESQSSIKAIKQAEQFQVDGIIFLGSFFNNGLIEISKNNNMLPLVVIGRDVENLGVRIVNINNYEAGKNIASLFLSMNYSTFGYVGGNTEKSVKMKRFVGFKETLEKNRKKINLKLTVLKYDSIDAYKTMKQYIENMKFSINIDAIFCETDTIAIGVIDALKEFDLYKQISIIGFDNIQLASSCSYQLTTYDQNIPILVEKAIEMIYRYDHNIYIEGKIVFRKSHFKEK